MRPPFNAMEPDRLFVFTRIRGLCASACSRVRIASGEVGWIPAFGGGAAPGTGPCPAAFGVGVGAPDGGFGAGCCSCDCA